jgi:hypothetical protein
VLGAAFRLLRTHPTPNARAWAPAQLRVRCAETKETDVLRATLEAEHADLDDDCKRVEEELTVARSEARAALRERRCAACASQLQSDTRAVHRRRRKPCRHLRKPRRLCGKRKRWSASRLRQSTTCA